MKRVHFLILLAALALSLLMYPETYTYCFSLVEETIVTVKLNTYLGDNVPTLPPDQNKTPVVFMFDDGWKSVFSSAYPLFNKYGFKASVSIIPSMVREKEYLSLPEIGQLYMDGWDILNGSYSHKEMIYDKSEALLADFNKSRNWMDKRYLTKSRNMAVCPFGEVNPYLVGIMKETGYENVRTAENIIILDADKIHYVPVLSKVLLSNVEPNEIITFLRDHRKEEKTIIFILNKISPAPDKYLLNYDPGQLESILEFIYDSRDLFQVISYSDCVYHN